MHEKPTTWAKQCRHHLGPPPNVREPAKRADPGVHQVEPTGPQRLDCSVELALDEVNVDADLRRKLCGGDQSRG